MVDGLSVMCASGIYNPDNNFQRSCFQFCFMDYIQSELDKTATLWNSHRIRPDSLNLRTGVFYNVCVALAS